MLNDMDTPAPLECPLCRAARFCREVGGNTVVFSVDAAGNACDCTPANAVVPLSPDTLVHCTGCSWSGEVRAVRGAA